MSTTIVMKDIFDFDRKGRPANLGFFIYQSNLLEFYKYKPLSGSYNIFIYIVVAIIRLFLKDKLVYSIHKDQINSITIERGKDNITQGGKTGRFLKAFADITGQNTISPDILIITTKNNETYKFITAEDREDHSSFDDLVVNMGMMLS